MNLTLDFLAVLKLVSDKLRDRAESSYFSPEEADALEDAADALDEARELLEELQ